LLLHHDEEPGTHSVEHQANVFASEFLAPVSEIADLLPSKVDWKRLMDLKATWGISMQALLFRARSLKVMPEYTYRRAVTELNRRGWRMKEPGDDGQTEQPIVLRRAIEMLDQQGRTLDDLSDESRLSIETIEMIAAPDDRPAIDLTSE
jgi:Zn-dependent peptidase ImmA (M78 family)